MQPNETTTVEAIVDGVRQLQLETTSIVGDVADLSAKLRALHLEEVRQRDTFADPADFFLQPRWKRNAASGDVMVESLLTFLARYDRTDFKRSKEQREMHVLWTMASLRQIYAHEYAAKMPALLRRFKVKSFSPYVAMFAMRRFGKTVAMAMWVAGFLWTQRKSVINVFSISQRTSIAMKWIEYFIALIDRHSLAVAVNHPALREAVVDDMCHLQHRLVPWRAAPTHDQEAHTALDVVLMAKVDG